MSEQYLKFLGKLKPTASKTPASWKDVLSVTPCRYPTGSPKAYMATIYPDWSFAEFALGGVLYALSLEAAKKHIKITLPKLDLPDAVSSSISFFKPASCGQIVIKVADLNIGGQYSNFRVTIHQRNPKTQTDLQCSECLVTLGNLERESRRPNQLEIPRPDQPLHNAEARQRPTRDNWVEVPMQSKVPGFYQTKPGARILYPPKTPLNNPDGSQPHPTHGPLVREHWWRGTDPWTAAHLPVYVDSFPPLHSNFPTGFTYWGPTLSMSMDLYKRPATTRKEPDKDDGAEWLWGRIELLEHRGGRYLGDFTVRDEEGDTVALGRIVNLALPYQAFDKPKNKKEKKESKI